MDFTVEMTDTFAGEANYAICKRVTFSAPAALTNMALVRRAKAHIGWTGVPCRTIPLGDTLEIRPKSGALVAFVYPA